MLQKGNNANTLKYVGQVGLGLALVVLIVARFARKR